MRLGGMATAGRPSSTNPGLDQLLGKTMVQVSWTCAASLVCAVVKKLTACVRRAAAASSPSWHTQQPPRLASRSQHRHGISLDHAGSALEVLSCAWEVLSADDTLISASPHHCPSLHGSVKHLLQPNTQAGGQQAAVHTAMVLLHIHAASADLQVCCLPTLPSALGSLMLCF